MARWARLRGSPFARYWSQPGDGSALKPAGTPSRSIMRGGWRRAPTRCPVSWTITSATRNRQSAVSETWSRASYSASGGGPRGSGSSRSASRAPEGAGLEEVSLGEAGHAPEAEAERLHCRVGDPLIRTPRANRPGVTAPGQQTKNSWPASMAPRASVASPPSISSLRISDGGVGRLSQDQAAQRRAILSLRTIRRPNTISSERWCWAARISQTHRKAPASGNC